MTDSQKISKFLLNAIIVGVFFILFAPLVLLNQYFFPFITPRNVFFRIAVEVVFAAWLALAHLNPEYRPNFKHWNKLTWLVVGFFAANVLSTIFSIGVYSSIWGNYERMSGLFHYAHLLMFFLVLVNVFKNIKSWHIFLSFSLFVGTMMSLLALSQWFEVPFLLKSSGGERLTATVGNPTFLASYLIFDLFFALYFLVKRSRFSLKTFAFSFFVFDAYLVASSILFKIFSDANWGFLGFLKLPLLSETLKRVFASEPEFASQEIQSSIALFSCFFVLQVVIAAAWWFRRHKYSEVAVLGVLAAFYFFIIFNTQTRGAILGLAAGFGLLALAGVVFKADKKIKLASAIFLAVLVAVPVLLFSARNSAWVTNNGTLNRLASISLTDVTTESRLLTWQASWQGMISSPKAFLVGQGPENYYYVFNKNFPTAIYRDSGSQIWFDRAHNIIFDVGVTTGVIGLAVYLAILAAMVWGLYRNYKAGEDLVTSFILAALVVAYLIQNFFVFDTLNTEILFYFFLGFLAFLLSQRPGQESPEEVENRQEKPVNYIYLSGLALVLLFGIFAINIKTLKANHYIYQALVGARADQSYQDNFDLLKKAVDQAVVGKFEARQQLSTYVTDLSNNPDVPQQILLPMIKIAGEELRKTVEEEPLNVRHHVFMSAFYTATTKFDRSNSQKVINLLDPAAIELSPTRPQVYFEIGQAYAFSNNFEKSWEYFKKGQDLAPWVIEDRWNLLTIAIVFEKYDLADQTYQAMMADLNWQPTVSDLERLVGLYTRVNNVEKMISIQESIIAVDPTAIHYAQVATFYAKVGENQKARQATAKAVELDPNFSADAKNFLELLDSGELLDK